ncbi:MAG: ribonuclease P protein component [Proteobacteria bacterium]|nr:ribonuclease P protein component [Pseudomonadota bacterium]HQR03533.1 ribonuclease P protein component [Rhodocyclaceae bacterium]
MAVGEARFRPEHRLLEAGEYTKVFAYRQTLKGKRFDLHYRPNRLDTARLGLVVPKRCARRAVLRNAIKRQARECFRHYRSHLPAMDLVLRLARPITTDQVPASWRTEFMALLRDLANL